MVPMAVSSQDPIGSMGVDASLAVLSNRPRLLYDYFKQGFAQVTNPAIDPIREELVMSLTTLIGPRPNLFAFEKGGAHKRLEATQPILSNSDLEKVRRIEARTEGIFKTHTLSICFVAEKGASGMEPAVQALCENAENAVIDGNNILILSDRDMDASQVAIPGITGNISRSSSSY